MTRQLAPLRPRDVHGLRQTVEEQLAVGQTRQRVVIGDVGELLLFADVIQCERDVAGKILEQFQLFVVEETGFCRVEHQYAHHLVGHDERHGDEGTVAACQGFLFEHRMRVGLDVVRHHYFLVTNGLADRARILFQTAERGADFVQITLIGSFPHQRRCAHAARLYQADPGHAKAALLYGDAARFAKQFAPVANAHDGRIDPAEHGLNAAQAGDAFLLHAPLRNVAGHPAVADEGLVLIQQRQCIDVQPANAALGVTQVQYQVAPAALLAGPSTDQLDHHRARARRDDVEAVRTDQIGGLVAEDGVHRRTAEGVYAPHVDLPDPFLRGLCDRTKALLADTQGRLGANPVGDVLDLVDEVMRPAGLQPDQGAADLRPDHPSVFADVTLVRLIGLDFSREHLSDLQAVHVAILGMGDGLHVAAQQLAFGVADDLAQRGVDSQPPAVRRDQGGAHRRVVHGKTKPLFALLEFAQRPASGVAFRHFLQCALDRRDQPGPIVLQHVIDRALPQRFDGAFLADGSRDEYERRIGPSLQRHLQGKSPVEFRQRVIGQNQIRREAIQRLFIGGRSLDAAVDDAQSAVPHFAQQHFCVLHPVLDQQYFDLACNRVVHAFRRSFNWEAGSSRPNTGRPAQ